MIAPPWYTASESFLLSHGRGAILLVLAIVIAVSVFYFVRVYKGKSLIPAATWTTYVLMP